MTPTLVTSLDLAIADFIVRLEGNPALEALLREKGAEVGGKGRIDKQEFARFTQAIAGKPVVLEAGGSSANTLTTLAKLLGDRVDIHFLSALGQSGYSQIIRSALEEARVRLVPETFPFAAGKSPETAVSFVVMLPAGWTDHQGKIARNGDRTIVTYPGNARELFTRDLIPQELIGRTNIVFLQASAFEKFHVSVPDALLENRIEQHREVILALPTTAQFGEPLGGRDADYFHRLVTGANLVISNETEICRTFSTGDGGQPAEVEAAMRRMQETFKKNALKPRRMEQFGIVTCGQGGGFAVTADRIVHRPTATIPESEVVQTLGAGDAASAGAIAMYITAGYRKGITPELCLEAAMAMGGAKVKAEGARLADPRSALRSMDARLAGLLLGA